MWKSNKEIPDNLTFDEKLHYFPFSDTVFKLKFSYKGSPGFTFLVENLVL